MKCFIWIFLLSTSFITDLHAQSDSLPERDSTMHIKEIIITGRKQSLPVAIQENTWIIKPDFMRTLPHFMGDTDPLKVFQLLPGITTGGDLNGSIYVRGSEPGHNYVSIDQIPVYNPSHLLGIFSVFNNDHFSSFSLQKSYISGEYDGRLAGVLEMTPGDSVLKKPEVKGNTGILASRVTTGIPTGRNSTLYLSLRATYINPILSLIEGQFQQSTTIRYSFQDYNLTYVCRPGQNRKIVINGYFGTDLMKYSEYQYQSMGTMRWTNALGSVRMERKFKNDLLFTNRLYATRYATRLNVHQNELYLGLPSALFETGYKGQLKGTLKNTRFQAGVHFASYYIKPEYPQTKNFLDGINDNIPPSQKATGLSGYFELERNIGSIRLQTSLRYSGNKMASSYSGGLEPRMQMTYYLPRGQELYGSFLLKRQYINQIVVSSIGFPLDFWVSSSNKIPAQKALEWNLGYKLPVNSNYYTLSVESYFRQLKHQSLFDGGLYDMITKNYTIEEHIATGKGINYGFEILFTKNYGKLRGWVSYTLAYAKRRFPRLRQSWFPAKYDRRHNLNICMTYHLNSRWNFSSVFIYASGNATTYPEAMYMVGENAVTVYSPYNGSRMPAYHRMDISANYTFGKKRNQSLNFSIYNIYKRHNPLFVQMRVKPSSSDKSLQIKLRNMPLYSILPSVSYTFNF